MWWYFHTICYQMSTDANTPDFNDPLPNEKVNIFGGSVQTKINVEFPFSQQSFFFM